MASLLLLPSPLLTCLYLQLDRYYSKYTEEIRENFERGTAL